MKLDRHDAHYIDWLLAAERSRQAILVLKQGELDDPAKRRWFELFRTGLRAVEVELLANILPLIRTRTSKKLRRERNRSPI